MAVGLETDFYGPHQRDHGTHEQDIVPAFTIENPRPDDPPSFPGQNWDERGQAIYNAGCEEPAPPPTPDQPEPEKKVRICHATSSNSNPYTSQRTGDREQRRPQRRSSQPHRPGLSREGLGRHHPALQLRRPERPAADLPRLQLEPRGSGDLAEQLRAAASAGSADRSRSRRSSSASRTWGAASSWPTSGTRTRMRRPSSPRRARTASRRRRRIAGSRPHSPRVWSRTPSRWSWTEAHLTWSLTGNTRDGLERLAEVRRLDHDRQEARPSGRSRPLQPEDRRRGRRRRGCGRDQGDDGNDRGSPGSHTRRASPQRGGRRSPTTTSRSSAVTTVRRGPATGARRPVVDGAGTEGLRDRLHHHEHGRAEARRPRREPGARVRRVQRREP